MALGPSQLLLSSLASHPTMAIQTEHADRIWLLYKIGKYPKGTVLASGNSADSSSTNIDLYASSNTSLILRGELWIIRGENKL